MKMMILITDIHGFVGSNLVEALEKWRQEKETGGRIVAGL